MDVSMNMARFPSLGVCSHGLAHCTLTCPWGTSGKSLCPWTPGPLLSSCCSPSPILPLLPHAPPSPTLPLLPHAPPPPSTSSPPLSALLPPPLPSCLLCALDSSAPPSSLSRTQFPSDPRRETQTGALEMPGESSRQETSKVHQGPPPQGVLGPGTLNQISQTERESGRMSQTEEPL